MNEHGINRRAGNSKTKNFAAVNPIMLSRLGAKR
jgi:hypothetical protein